MDAFSYLSALISIVIGLAITQTLQGFRGLMLARSRLRSYWPCVLWAILLLVIDVQAWWAMFALKDYANWSFLAFAVVLAETIPLYLLAGLVFPDIGVEGPIDLRTHYFDNHRRFFTLAVLLVVISIAKPLVLSGTWPKPLDLAFQVMFIVTAAVGALTRREWYHKTLAPFIAIWFAVYIAVLFARLGQYIDKFHQRFALRQYFDASLVRFAFSQPRRYNNLQGWEGTLQMNFARYRLGHTIRVRSKINHKIMKLVRRPSIRRPSAPNFCAAYF
ncbi:MAG: hypothetical protein ACRES7_08675 [Gammaproteobacteria bacterium]